MASQTLTSVADVWPAGTSVGAYKRSDWPQASLPPSGAPPGSAAATATVASDGSLAFSGLADSTTYFAGASVSGTWRYRGFSTPQLSAGSGSDVGTATRDSAGRISAFGTTTILARDGQGRITSYSDGATTYTVTYGTQGVAGVATA